jgi:hypothetical protein
MSLRLVVKDLDDMPNVVDTDLKAVTEFIDAVADIFPVTRKGVFVNRAVMELENETGYPVGHILFISDNELYKFVPHSDDQDKEA